MSETLSPETLARLELFDPSGMKASEVAKALAEILQSPRETFDARDYIWKKMESRQWKLTVDRRLVKQC